MVLNGVTTDPAAHCDLTIGHTVLNGMDHSPFRWSKHVIIARPTPTPKRAPAHLAMLVRSDPIFPPLRVGIQFDPVVIDEATELHPNAELEGTRGVRASRGDEHSVAAGYCRMLLAQCKDANGAATARSSGYRRPPTDPARPQWASR